MSKTPLPPLAQSQKLMDMLFDPELADNPYNFVMTVFPWRQPGTPLANESGPRDWQKDELLQIHAHIVENRKRVARGEDPKVYKSATASGRGVGKSALVAWLNLWHMSCHFGSTAIVSANTAEQLTTKTFGEIGKWYTMLPNKFWFERLQTKIMPAPWMESQMGKPRDQGGYDTDIQYNYVSGQLWNEDDPHAFAGAHNPNGMMVTFDEASGIPESIWVVTRGFFTEKSIYRFWLAFSNPRSGQGAFFDCFHIDKPNWYTRQVDAMSIKGLDNAELQEIIDKYGPDSREARVEVRGEFPQQGDRQFISRAVVAEACTRQLDRSDDNAPLAIGVDPARFGDDHTVICFRRGRDARSIPPVVMKNADNMEVANKVAHLIDQFNPEGVFIDAGAGSGIIDRLREMGYKIWEVNFGTASVDQRYFDHRTELWQAMKDWLPGSMLDPYNRDLADQLCWPEFEFMGREDKLKLESKEKMKKRKLRSPDHADALAVTFHAKLSRSDFNSSRKKVGRKNRVVGGVGGDVDFG
jgi:hypothetical protein